MPTTRTILIPALVGLLALGGCSAQPAPTPQPISAEDTCAQVGDVLTILANADASLREGRSVEQEHAGAVRLAARILSRVQVAPDTDLADSVAAVKAIAKPSAVGVMNDPFDPSSSEWELAIHQVGEDCTAAGSELGLEMWTGG